MYTCNPCIAQPNLYPIHVLHKPWTLRTCNIVQSIVSKVSHIVRNNFTKSWPVYCEYDYLHFVIRCTALFFGRRGQKRCSCFPSAAAVWVGTYNQSEKAAVGSYVYTCPFWDVGFFLSLGLKFSDPFLCLKAVLLIVSSYAKDLASQTVHPFSENQRKWNFLVGFDVKNSTLWVE